MIVYLSSSLSLNVFLTFHISLIKYFFYISYSQDQHYIHGIIIGYI